MQDDASSAPDGTLAIGNGIWIIDDSGQTQWEEFPLQHIDPKVAEDLFPYYSEYRYRRCVWLDENKIAAGNDSKIYTRFDEYIAELEENKLRGPQELNWEPSGLFTNLFMAFKTNEKNQMQHARDAQHYRPLTYADRIRFLEKQQCMKRAYEAHTENFIKHTVVEEACDPSGFPIEPER